MSEPQRIAKRKTHTKSRKGCLQCKQRHSKCNEAQPRCANCQRLDINCTWPAAKDAYLTSPHPSPGGYATPALEDYSSGSPDITHNRSAFELFLPDMKLLHHWTTHGYRALNQNLASRSDIWQNGMVELGFEHPFLLHGILALSAVHKASFLVPTDRQDLLLQADIHISQALDTMRTYLSAPNEQQAVPMFVLSSVLLTYNFGSVQEKPEDPIGSVHHCLMLLSGIKVVIGAHWQKILNTPGLANMLEMSSAATLQTLDALAKDDECPEILRLMELTELVLDTQDKAVCTKAIEALNNIAVRFQHIGPEHDKYPYMFMWPAHVNTRFLHLLAARSPVACIITVHWAALLAQVPPEWWIVKWPGYILSASEQLLAATPDLLSWLDWPQSIIDSDQPWTR